MSAYPNEAVELSLTVLIPVTEDNRPDVDGAVHDLLNGAGLTWWPSKVAHYDEGGLVVEYGFKRPARFVRPRRKRRAA